MTDAQIEQIVAAVERRIAALPGTARRKDRKQETIRVRQIVFFVLSRAGLSAVAIGKNFGMDDSSVIHLLEKVEGLVHVGTWWEETRFIAERILSGGKRNIFNARLEKGVWHLGTPERQAVVSYANGPLLGWTRHNPQVEAYGLTVVTRDRRARDGLEQALILSELGEHIPRVEMQARSMERRGYVQARS